MDVEREVVAILDRVLDLGPRASALRADSPLLGAVPELDSMAVATLITALEEHFGFAIDDDEIDGSVFATVGSLAAFVGKKLAPG